MFAWEACCRGLEHSIVCSGMSWELRLGTLNPKTNPLPLILNPAAPFDSNYPHVLAILICWGFLTIRGGGFSVRERGLHPKPLACFSQAVGSFVHATAARFSTLTPCASLSPKPQTLRSATSLRFVVDCVFPLHSLSSLNPKHECTRT